MDKVNELKAQIIDLFKETDLMEIKSEISNMLSTETDEDVRLALHSARIELIRLKLNASSSNFFGIDNENINMDDHKSEFVIPQEEDNFPWSIKNR